MADSDGDLIEMKQANSKEDSDADVLTRAGNADLAAHIEANGLVHNLGYGLSRSARLLD